MLPEGVGRRLRCGCRPGGSGLEVAAASSPPQLPGMMTRTIWWMGLAAAVAMGGCASMRGERAGGGNPVAQRTEASQKQSKEALQRATDAQKKAQDQAQKAADAQVEVQKSQQALVKSQQKAQQEQQKAQDLQNQANQLRQQADQASAQAQARASQSLQQQGQQLARHEQATVGQITHASANALSLQLQDGTSMDFSVNPSTRVIIDGKASQATELQPGEDAHVTYKLSGAQPVATAVQAASGTPGAATGPQGAGESQQGQQGSSGSQSGSSQSQQPEPQQQGGSSGTSGGSY